MLTDDEIRALQSLEAQATPGPWEWQTGCSWRRIGTSGSDGNVLCPDTYSKHDRQPDLRCSDEDAATLIAARNALRQLCDEVLRLRALLKDVPLAREDVVTDEVLRLRAKLLEAVNAPTYREWQRLTAENAALRGRLNALVEAAELVEGFPSKGEWLMVRKAIAAAKEPPKPQGGDPQ